jgi:hypothetical protein
MKMKQKVALVFCVPDGDYCWDEHDLCEHFNNERGILSCNFSFWEQKREHGTSRVLKPFECKSLPIFKEDK